MKICPRCQKTYADDNLNFCLEDGTVLNQHVSPQDTIRMSPPPGTRQPYGDQITNPQQQVQFSGQPQYGQPPKKRSKAWVWVLLILGAVVVLCGGGLLGTFYYIGSQVENMANIAANSERNRNRNNNVALVGNRNSANTAAKSPPSQRQDLTEVDLEIFVKEGSPYGTTTIDNDQLTMGAMSKGYYYALAAPANYTTVDSDTRVTVSNPTNAGGSLGYGLIFHSNPLPLQQDYAFLIDAKTGKYRIVRHSPKKEDIVTDWTASPAIVKGTGDNTLEVRDAGDKIELYINGTMVTTIRNQYGYPNGVVGLYSGDGIKAVFKDLQIRK